MRDTLCTKCRNPECEYAGRKVWVMICAHEYMAPPQTKADRIRAFTDEELAEFVNDLFYGLNENPGMCDVCDHDSVQNCKQCWFDWLRQEAT